MKTIPLSQGKVAIVDDVDFERLSQYTWHYSTGYAMRFTRNPVPEHILMHREILHAQPGLITDHIDGNRLNNQRANLRECTYSENSRNRAAHRDNATGFKGVSKHRGKFRAQIFRSPINKHLGLFPTAQAAADAYAAAALKDHGEFARTK